MYRCNELDNGGQFTFIDANVLICGNDWPILERNNQVSELTKGGNVFTIKILAIVAPLLVLSITPILYFTGALFDAVILNRYGLGEVLLDKTTQQVIEQGFTSFVVGISPQLKTFITLGYLVLVMISAGIGGLLAAPLSRGEQNRVERRREIMFKVLLSIASIPALLMVIFFPAGCAILAANAQLEANDKAVAAGCVRCMVYRTKSGDLRGIAVAGEKDRIIVVQSDSSHIVKLDDLIEVISPKSDVTKPAARG